MVHIVGYYNHAPKMKYIYSRFYACEVSSILHYKMFIVYFDSNYVSKSQPLWQCVTCFLQVFNFFFFNLAIIPVSNISQNKVTPINPALRFYRHCHYTSPAL